MTTRPPIDLEALREDTAPAWDELREQRVLAGVRDRIDGREPAPPTADDLPLVGPSRRAPTIRRGAMIGGGALAAVAAALVAWWTGAVGGPAPARVSVAEGVEARIDDEGALRVVRHEPGRTLALEQRGGTIAYDVDPARRQQVEVWVSGVVVRVVGTVFVVADGDPVTVSVEQGVVQVTDARGTVRVVAGERRRFSPVHRGPSRGNDPADPVADGDPSRPLAAGHPRPAIGASPDDPDEGGGHRPTSSDAAAPGPEARPGTATGDHVETGNDDAVPSGPEEPDDDRETADAPSNESRRSGRPTFEDLVARADRARQNGDLARAAGLYADALREPGHPGGRGTALFTLAVIEEQRGHHAAAARRFRAYRVRVAGSLTEEALAAEARNWRLAGDDDQAAAARRLYRSLFPAGQYADGL